MTSSLTARKFWQIISHLHRGTRNNDTNEGKIGFIVNQSEWSCSYLFGSILEFERFWFTCSSNGDIPAIDNLLHQFRTKTGGSTCDQEDLGHIEICSGCYRSKVGVKFEGGVDDKLDRTETSFYSNDDGYFGNSPAPSRL